MINIKYKFYQRINSGIYIGYHDMIEVLMPDKPYDYLFELDRAKRKLEHSTKYTQQEVSRQCNQGRLDRQLLINNKL